MGWPVAGPVSWGCGVAWQYSLISQSRFVKGDSCPSWGMWPATGEPRRTLAPLAPRGAGVGQHRPLARREDH